MSKSYTEENINFSNILGIGRYTNLSGPYTNYGDDELELKFGDSYEDINRKSCASSPIQSPYIFTTNAIDIHWGGALWDSIPSELQSTIETTSDLLKTIKYISENASGGSDNPYANQYLTFAPDAQTNFKFTFAEDIQYDGQEIDLYYSLNDGETWEKYENNELVSVDGDEDQVILWKFGIGNTRSSETPNGLGKFWANGNFDVYGNIMSLIYGDNFKNKTTWPNTNDHNITLQNLFYENTYLNYAGNLVLPVTLLNTANCYGSMFYGCTSLWKGPELPATILSTYCYESMFYGCTSLTEVSDLPAKTLANNCYDSMFSGCTSLTTAPELPATQLRNNCYNLMFEDCTNLNYIKALFTTTPSNSYTSNWIDGVSSTGTFVKNREATWNVTGVNGIPSGWICVNDKDYSQISIDGAILKIDKNFIEKNHDYSNDYLTFIALESGSFTFTATYSNRISYSINNGNWITAQNSAVTVNVAVGDKIRWKGIFDNANENDGIGKFTSTKSFNVEGNIMSLIWGDDFVGKTVFTDSIDETVLGDYDYIFYQLFYNASKLINCKNLVLPAVSLRSCCYQQMFYGCSSLITGPSILPATTLYGNCYQQMFKNCTSLTTAPELPATILVSNCYSEMFRGCTKLIKAPELPATTLVSNCYQQMFNGCTKLKYVKAMFTNAPGTSYTSDWVKDVSANGIFVKNISAEWSESDPNMIGAKGIPSGWIVQYDVE